MATLAGAEPAGDLRRDPVDWRRRHPAGCTDQGSRPASHAKAALLRVRGGSVQPSTGRGPVIDGEVPPPEPEEKWGSLMERLA